MLFRLYEALRVVVIAPILAQCASPGAVASFAPSEQTLAAAKISRALPSEYADPDLREADGISVCGQRLMAICASPSHPVAITGKPPYAMLFIALLEASRWRVKASAVCTGDVLVERIIAMPDAKCGIAIGAVTRQYGGSVAICNLRLYRYDAKTSQFHRQVAVRYVDGGTVPLPGRSGRSPGFLVVEPLYDTVKFNPQRYRFRLYTAPSSKGYSLGLTMVSRKRYGRLEGAYDEVRPRLQKAVGSSFSIPLRSALSPGEPIAAPLTTRTPTAVRNR